MSKKIVGVIDSVVPLASVLCTEELHRRTSRPPDYAAEIRAMTVLVQALADSPRTILQTLADTILTNFNAHSAGLSLLTKDGKRFYWPAIAGLWKHHVGGGTAREFGPCGDVLDCNGPLLFAHFERRYHYLLKATPNAEECLLVPFHVKGKAVGTIWMMAHNELRHFDAEDLRQLESLGRFASAAYQAVESMGELESRKAESVNLREEVVQSDLLNTALHREISERKQVEERLHQNNNTFFRLIQNAPFGLYVVDAQFRLSQVSTASQKVFANIDPLIGRDFEEVMRTLWTDPFASEALARFRHTLATGEPFAASNTVQQRYDNMAVESYDWKIERVTLPNGELGVVCYFYDVTERNLAAEALRQSEGKLRDFVENATIGLHWVGPNGHVIWANQTELDLLGYTREEYIGHSITEFHADPLVIEKILTRLLGGETLRDHEARLRCKDGSVRHVVINSNALFEDGKLVYIRCFTRDFTERKKAENALRESEARFRTLFEMGPVAVYSIDTSGLIREFNGHAAELWGRTPALGDTDERFCGSFKLYCPDGTFMPYDKCSMAQVVHGEIAEARDGEVLIERPDGSHITVIVNIRPLKNPNGEITGAINCFYDISARKRAEQHAEMLTTLSRELAPVTEEAEIVRIAVDTVGRHLNAHRCYFVECLEDQNRLIVSPNYVRDEAPSIAGELSLFDFGGVDWWRQFASGDFFIEDVATNPLTQAKSASYATVGVPSYAVQPFRREGDWAVCLVATEKSPRKWTAYDLRVLDDVVARAWPLVEKARANLALLNSEERYRTLFNSVDEGFSLIEMIYDEHEKPIDFRFLEVNPAFEKLTGMHDVAGKCVRGDIDPAHEDYWFEMYGKVAQTGEPVRYMNEAKQIGCWLDIYACRVGGPKSRKVAVLFTNITERKRTQLLIATQKEVLELEARGAALQDILQCVVNAARDYSGEQSRASVFLLEPDGQHLRFMTGAGLPEAYIRAVDNFEVGPHRPSCGNAAFTGQPAIVKDVNTDPLWAPFLSLAKEHDMRAIWSQPLRTLAGKVMGTLALYHRTPREPGPGEMEAIVLLGQTAALVIERSRDAERRLEAEAALRASEVRYRQLFNSMDEGYCVVEMIFDANNKPVDFLFLEVNQAFEKQSGISNAVGRRMREIAPKHEEHWFETYGKVAQTGEPVRFIHEAKELDGRWFDFYASRIGGRESRKLAVIFSDITSRKLMVEALSESEERYRNLFSLIDEGFCLIEMIFDKDIKPVDYRFLEVNPSFAKQSGLSGATGKRVTELVPNIESRWFETYGHVALTGESVRVTSEVKSMNRWLDVYACRVGGPGSRKVGVVFNDITEKKRAEQSLFDAAKAKDEFLATLAHELRNPLAPIRNSLEIMERAGGNMVMMEDARIRIERQMNKMVHLVDDLMDISRISTGKVVLRKQQVELGAVIKEAVESVQNMAQCAGQEISVALPDGPIYLDADPVRLSQILGNLLSNACKYTDSDGQISIRVERDEKTVVIRIKDTGIGIAEEMLPRVFNRFIQIDHSLERTHGGLGLGLSIVRSLVQMHGGTVEAFSPGLNQGSEFVLRIPIVQGAKRANSASLLAIHAPAVDAPAKKRRILVADDNMDSAESLALLLTIEGHEVRTAFDGFDAVATAETFQPEVAFLDIGMPRLNGYDTAREIRKSEWGRSVFLVALTGWGQEHDRRNALEAGFNQHFVKPADIDNLRRVLSTLK